MVYTFDVVLDTIVPVIARRGQVLVWRPAEGSVLVVLHGTTTVVREGTADAALLARLYTGGVIAPRSPAGLARLAGANNAPATSARRPAVCMGTRPRLV